MVRDQFSLDLVLMASYVPSALRLKAGVADGGGGGGVRTPRFWQNRKCRRTVAALRITTYPPRFSDLAPSLESIPVCVQFADCTSCPLFALGMYGRYLLYTCYFQLAALWIILKMKSKRKLVSKLDWKLIGKYVLNIHSYLFQNSKSSLMPALYIN